MKTILSIVSSLAILMSAMLPAKADLLNNGNFNTGTLPNWWAYTPDTANQSITVLPADAFSYDNTPYAHTIDHGGSSAAVLGQEVDLSGGSQYSVSLAYRANNWGGGGGERALRLSIALLWRGVLRDWWGRYRPRKRGEPMPARTQEPINEETPTS